ncbi:hypothetical protein PDJAM_G00158380 [Pangasius djambal]|uniref:Uncharacterized protein n=1 Tax=Pangasius djambal TaxID=1691987 RepID=A0ACC5ZK24_9TELE|nr:hypothetical protein [Pangasius djambal]
MASARQSSQVGRRTLRTAGCRAASPHPSACLLEPDCLWHEKGSERHLGRMLMMHWPSKYSPGQLVQKFLWLTEDTEILGCGCGRSCLSWISPVLIHIQLSRVKRTRGIVLTFLEQLFLVLPA